MKIVSQIHLNLFDTVANFFGKMLGHHLMMTSWSTILENTLHCGYYKELKYCHHLVLPTRNLYSKEFLSTKQ